MFSPATVFPADGLGPQMKMVARLIKGQAQLGARRQVFWRDRLTGETLLVSASAAGAEGNDDSFAPAISADGLTVVFESHASNLVAGDGNGVGDVPYEANDMVDRLTWRHPTIKLLLASPAVQALRHLVHCLHRRGERLDQRRHGRPFGLPAAQRALMLLRQRRDDGGHRHRRRSYLGGRHVHDSLRLDVRHGQCHG